MKTPFVILIHAHDYMVARREIPLAERQQTSDILIKAIIRLGAP